MELDKQIEKLLAEQKLLLETTATLNERLEEISLEIEEAELKNAFSGVPETAEEIEELFEKWQKNQLGKKLGTYSAREWAGEQCNIDDFPNFSFKYLDGSFPEEDYGYFVFSINVGEEIKSYWKWKGYYSSYDGLELMNLEKVEPKEKKVTVYE